MAYTKIQVDQLKPGNEGELIQVVAGIPKWILNNLQFVNVLPTTGVENVIYVDTADDTIHYWDGANWVSLSTGGGGGGIPEAPNDGELYGRRNATWEAIQPSGAVIVPTLPAGGTANTIYIQSSDNTAWYWDGLEWNPIGSEALNGLHIDDGTIKMGGALIEDTTIDGTGQIFTLNGYYGLNALKSDSTGVKIIGGTTSPARQTSVYAGSTAIILDATATVDGDININANNRTSIPNLVSSPLLTVNTTASGSLSIDPGTHAVLTLIGAVTINIPTTSAFHTVGDGSSTVLRIKDNGTARAITWGSSIRAIGVTLPTTTVVNKILYVGLKLNLADSKWDVLAVNQEA